MQPWLDNLIDLAAIKGDEAILKDALGHLTEQAGFDGYAYLYIRPGHMIAASNYHRDWQSIYFQQKLADIDPVVSRAKSLKQAFTWSGEGDRSRLSKAERTFYANAAEFGIRSGITIPIRAANGSLSMFTLSSGKTAIDLGRDIDPVAAAAAVGQLHTRMSLLPMTPSERYPAWLDPREAAYLNWIAVGKTMEEVAQLEGVKYNSVKSKLEEARKRFKIHTMPHLVALAIRAGLI
ncbi:Transcriptional activator protein TraR [Agrobacterium tumefaciens str. Kerr 14]|uniref:Transcriptional activator protein TraR n=1 Tax=Agrobacterium tumefaciens str. Kerr 14 TaxID=1183424 RepID=A0A1S7SB06_AGRTU|nr:transcriptional regulator TraR [Agrobacterium tumefaciens]CUX65738.1 Transcriptional activator protein TraR [Agrobacterium tumefaciens str. Kerr 14]